MGFGPIWLALPSVFPIGLNALTGIDGIWTYSTLWIRPILNLVLMPLRALMGFGPSYGLGEDGPVWKS